LNRLGFGKTVLIVLLGLLIILLTGFSVACSKSAPASSTSVSGSPEPASSSSNIIPSSPLNPVLTALPGTNVKLRLNREAVKKGENFAAEVYVETRYALRGAQWSLVFDPEVMRCESGSEGSFFRDWAKANNCSTTVFPPLNIDNLKGTAAAMGVAVLGPTRGGPAGSGVVYIYQFTALKELNSFPGLTGISAADAAGQMYPVTQ
jgi:hypothetical protein